MTKDKVLRLALEALTNAYWPTDSDLLPAHNIKECGEAISAIKEALAQPEQDLVEWGVDWGPDGNSVSIIKRLADGGIEVVGWEYAPHPPQRTWVGLTDEEINLIYAEPQTHIGQYAKAIETKLKDKNT